MKTAPFRGLMSTMAMILFLSTAVSQAQDNGKLDLNMATASELATLPGVGKILAGRIVIFREENGPFGRVEDLLNVQGIGERNFLRIRERVTVGETHKKPSGRK